jgi:hypothetical protein
MRELYAQGDLLIERVSDIAGRPVPAAADCAVVLAEGELTGHSHTASGRISFFRDDALARDIPRGLYLGHLTVADSSARVAHQEHATLELPQGTYRVRRQRELDPEEARVVAD